MCGIAGFIDQDGRGIDPTMARAMAETLKPRGPDDLGFLGFSPEHGARADRNPSVVDGATTALIHRRLSIIDLTDAGWQPMSTPDGRYHLVFNGEIYNYVEIRAELEKAGVTFRGHCDSEVLLHALARWGTEALPRLIGMFALALLDTNSRTLLLARDGFGIKPLYYSRFNGGFAFTSEIKALVDLPGFDRTINPQRMYDYLRFARTDGDPETMFKGINQLMPGHYVVVSLDPAEIQPQPFWSIRKDQHVDLSYAEATEQLRELFLDSVRLHLRSDVPVGTCLSGGIDSSAIVMAMRHVLGKDTEIHTFSYLPNESAISEEKWIDIVNEAAGAIPHKVRLSYDEFVSDLDALIWAQDEPFAGTSIYAQHRVFQVAHENGLKVMLDGQGADELIGGYQGMSRRARLVSMLRQKQGLSSIRYLINLAWRYTDVDLKELVRQSWRTALSTAEYRRVPVNGNGPQWLDHDWFSDHDVDIILYPELAGREALRSYLYDATTRSSLPHLLRYEDRNSMAFSIESRVPFLTPALAEFMFSLPEHYLVDDRGVTKSLFRSAMRGIVPDAILNRTDKIGFTTPINAWLRGVGEWVEEVLNSEMARRIPGLSPERMVAQWHAVQRRQRPFGTHIWRWVNFIRWAERFEPSFA